MYQSRLLDAAASGLLTEIPSNEPSEANRNLVPIWRSVGQRTDCITGVVSESNEVTVIRTGFIEVQLYRGAVSAIGSRIAYSEQNAPPKDERRPSLKLSGKE